MQIRNTFIIEDEFITAFDELLKIEMPAKQCLQMTQSLDKLVDQYKALKRTQLTIITKHTVLDDNGKITFDEKKNAIFKSPEEEQICKKEMGEIRKDTFEIPLVDKIKMYEDTVSTPRKMFLLQDVVEIVEREKSKTEKE
jgi:hypothetical protein